MSEVRALIERLVAAGLSPIDAAEIITRAAIVGAQSGPRSAAAVRQERYRRNKASQSVTRDAFDDVASPSPKESPQTPKEIPPSSPSTQQENPLRGQKKASRLPSDWSLPGEWRGDALAAGLPVGLIDLEAAKIRDWSRSSKNGAKLDWRATWRNWCREAAGRRPRSRAGPSPGAPNRPDVRGLIHQLQNLPETHNARPSPRNDSDRQDAFGLPAPQRAGLG